MRAPRSHVVVPWPETWATGAGGARGVRARRLEDGAEGLYQVSRGAFLSGPTAARAGAREAAALEVLGALYAHPADAPSAVGEAVTQLCLLLLAEEETADARAARRAVAHFDGALRTARRLRLRAPLVLPVRVAG
jgi:hypothetical protein